MRAHWRGILISALFAAVVTFIGAEAFLWGVHDSSLGLKVVLAVCLPFATIASTANFFDSNFVYLGSIASGFALWAYIAFLVISRLQSRKQLPPNKTIEPTR